MAVLIYHLVTLRRGPPQELFQTDLPQRLRTYDIPSDGQRFLVETSGESTHRRLSWFSPTAGYLESQSEST